MPILRTLLWIGPSRDDLRAFPDEARRNVGYALQFAQAGTKHPTAKPLGAFGGGVLEIVEDHAGDTYRAVYTVRFKRAVYVLHVFKKKSKAGIATPRHEIDLIHKRLSWATKHYWEFEATLPEIQS